ncbi:MAG: hypothetical protein RL038_288 [Actinomycetota bacterium]
MLIVVAPGQGSQTPGMLEPWLELPEFSEIIATASEASGLDLRAHGTTSDAETIKDTAIAQPLIVAAGIGSFHAALAAGADLNRASAFAGHSVGEFTATAISGVLTVAETLAVVSARGRAMANASGQVATGMVAVMGGERSDVVSKLAEFDLVAANENGAGQIVAAGELSNIDALVASAPAGLRLVQLPVAGAFHTHFMSSAQVEVVEALAKCTPKTPTVPVVSNKDAAALMDGNEIATRLGSQVTSPVRWDLCMEKFAELGVTGIVELFPGGTLTNLAKRGLKGVDLLPIKAPTDLENLREFVANHA